MRCQILKFVLILLTNYELRLFRSNFVVFAQIFHGSFFLNLFCRFTLGSNFIDTPTNFPFLLPVFVWTLLFGTTFWYPFLAIYLYFWSKSI